MSTAHFPIPEPNAEQSMQQGQACLAAGDVTGAIAHFSAALQHQPTPERFLKRASAYLSLKTSAAAILDAQCATQLDPSMAIAHHLLAKAHAMAGHVDEAIAAYKQAAHLYLNQADADSAKACIAQIDRLRASVLSQPSPSPQLSPPTAKPLISPQAFLEQALAKMEQRNYQGAIADLSWLLKFEPDQADVLCKRAYAYAKTGQAQAAIQDLARALSLDPENPNSIKQRGIVRLVLGDGRGAVQDFSQLLRNGGDPRLLLSQRAKAYAQMQAWDDAFKDYANALGFEPDNPDLYAGRAAVWEAKGDREEALKDYQQAATLWLNRGQWTAYQTMQDRIQGLQSKGKPNALRLLIKYMVANCPVVDVVLNGDYRFNMILDPQFSLTLISPVIARTANVIPSGKRWCYTNDGGMIELAVGLLQSVTLGSATHQNITAAIANQETEAVLGQDVLRHYQLRILDQEVELVPKSSI
ncbi:MAG: tetratricopeptide repeat protein [Elainellaceae cyanobacterium]